jgi:hypothetical protein
MTNWEWTEHAACAGHERIYFPLVDLDASRLYGGKRRRLELPETKLAEQARTICDGCPVNADCATQRDAGNEIGMWAGQMRHERTRRRTVTPTMQTAAVVIQLRPPTKPIDTRHTNARTRAAEASA